jgi:hypothetical protein
VLRVLSKSEKEEIQSSGYMCEHLLCLYSMVSDKIALYNNDFPVFTDGYGEADVVLFGLGKKGNEKEKYECVRELAKMPIQVLNIISPLSFQGLLNVKTRYVDWDFHIDVSQFDFDLKGRNYKNIRYLTKKAEKMGYHMKLTRNFTPKHTYVLSRHMAHQTLDIWDYEELLSLDRFFREHDHGFIMEAYLGDRLLGFDIVDFFENNRIMVVPLGIYLNAPLVSDFLMYENLKFARDKEYEWLDVGPTCQSKGLKLFKEKWFGKPKFKIYVQSLEIGSEQA